MDVVIKFNYDKGFFEVVSPAGLILKNINFHFPTEPVTGPAGVSNQPVGRPVVTVDYVLHDHESKTENVTVK